jgi:O-antigen ligase
VVVHNSYLDVLLEHGVVGLSLYLVTYVSLWGVGRRLPDRTDCAGDAPLDRSFLPIWRAMLTVFLVNGCFVVMSYQFVGALLFTVGGMIRAHEVTAASGGQRSAGGRDMGRRWLPRTATGAAR